MCGTWVYFDALVARVYVGIGTVLVCVVGRGSVTMGAGGLWYVVCCRSVGKC